MKMIIGFSGAVASFFFVPLFLLLFETPAQGYVEFLPSVSLSEEYTDNFFFLKSDKEDELTTILSPGVSVVYKTPFLMLTGNYLGGVELYVNQKEDNRYRQGLTFDIDLPFLSHVSRNIEVHVTEVADYAPTLPSVPLGDAARDRFRPGIGRVETFRNRAGIRVDYTGSPHGRTRLTYFNTNTQYKESLLEDFMVHDARLLQTVRVSRRGSLAASYSFLTTDFERADRFTTQGLSLGGDWAINETLSLHALAGGSRTKSIEPSFTSEIGLSKMVHVTRLDLDYLRGVGAGGDVIPAPTLRQTLSAKATHPINPKKLFDLALDYEQRTLLSDPTTGTISYSATTGITTLLFRWLEGSIRYTYFNYNGRGADTKDAAYNRILFTLRASVPGKPVE